MEHLRDEQLSALLDGDLAGDEAAAAAAHVAGCGRCRGVLGELERLRDAAGALEPLEPPARVDYAIRRAVLENRPVRPFLPRWAWAPLVAAVLVAAVVLVVGRRAGTTQPGAVADRPVSAEAAAASAADVEQYLEGIDLAIEECEAALAENPRNPRVQSAWLAAQSSRVESYDRLVSGGD
ncbi:MAG: zf-HC2 domain-containing protein [bacterium]